MKTLRETVSDKFPDMNFEDFTKAAERLEDYMFERRRNYCGICLKELTDREIQIQDYTQFTFCCEEHKEYTHAYQPILVRRNLGIKVTEADIFK